MATINWRQIAWMRLLLALAAIGLLGVLSRYVLGQSWNDLVKNLLPSLDAACIAAVVGWTLFRGISDNDQLLDTVAKNTETLIHNEVDRTTKAVLSAVYQSAEIGKLVTPLAPRQIRDHLMVVATNPSEYRFVGNSGKHLSAVTIPHLSQVESQSHEVSIWVQLLDPESEEGIRRYSDDRKCLKEDVIAEIYATILLTLVWSRTNPRLRVERLSLRPMPTHFRVDWSRSHCVITTEGKEDPGLALSNTNSTPNHLHAKVRDQLVASVENDRLIETPSTISDMPPGTSAQQVRDDALRAAFKPLAPASGYSNALATSVVAAFRKRTNPYG